jgi:aspartyl-tRNA(Asn)/glutamyl-tRNA(Gln) amidotransferase subunit B
MNSFSGVRRALEYEIPRQIKVLTKGGKLIQSTRRWDDVTGITEEMRTKEHAHDYRYFPDPDLMPQAPTDAWLAEVKSRVVELPLARKQRFMKDYGLPASDAQTFVWDVLLGNFFEKCAKELLTHNFQKDKNLRLFKTIANLLINNLRALVAIDDAFAGIQSNYEFKEDPFWGKGDLKFKADAIVELVLLVEVKKISISVAQQIVLPEMYKAGKSPAAIVQEKGLAQVSDTGAIEKFCDEAIAANPGPANDFRSGKAAALNFLKGQVMKLSKGKANPALAGEILERKLKG